MKTIIVQFVAALAVAGVSLSIGTLAEKDKKDGGGVGGGITAAMSMMDEDNNKDEQGALDVKQFPSPSPSPSPCPPGQLSCYCVESNFACSRSFMNCTCKCVCLR